MTRRGIYDVRTVWIAVIVVITLIGTARAQTVVCAHAERGGYDADDGNVFATDYWASEGNLAQVLALRGYLERAGATVELTRTQNRSIDDLPASQVAAIANAANADFFISIDTREQFGTVNYPTTLFRGYDASPAFPEAKAAADTLWRRLLESSEPFGVNYDGANFRGDLSFYSGDPDGSPVLKNLTMPGVESFGSFHDYVPESRRLADDDYQKFRAWTHAVSISRVLDLDPLPGAVAGVARNADKTIADFAIGDDQYAPIEEFVAEIDGYEAVSENNPAGFFFFGSVETDARIVILDAPEFYAATATIDAREDSVVVLAFFPDVDTTSPPTVVDYAPVGRPRNYDIIVEFSDPMNPTATESAFSVAPALTGTFAWENDTTTLVFTPDAYLAGPTDYDVSVSVAAESRYGVALAEPLAFGFETTPPDVLRTEPSSDADSVIVSSVVKIHFDQSMDRQSVEDAFRVTPDVSGAFAWRNESRTLAFAPYAELQGMTTYLVELDTTAASVFNTRLTDTFAFTFDTRDRYCMTTTYTYPLNGQVDVPPTAQFRFRFERPLDFSTLSGAVALYDEFGSEIDVARVNQFDKNDDGYLYFEPAAPLAPGAVHYLVIDESLLDDDGAPLCDAIDYSFATENIVASGGTLAADFESPIYWKDPLLAEGSRDLVESGVALSIDTTREREGVRMFASILRDRVGYGGVRRRA